MQELESLESLSFELTTLLLPWISILISIVFVFWFKDFATSLAKGLKFKQNPLFNEGDKVLLEGQDAIIVKILVVPYSVYIPIRYMAGHC